jgi:methyltransferase (TIGR00027 family)
MLEHTHEDDPMTSSIEATARWTAAVRAAETSRADRLFEDPWAAALAGPDGAAWLAGRPPGSTLPIAIRTRFFDDWLRLVAIDGGIRQVVLLAAGLDTRAYRLPWAAGTTVFELDLPAVLAGKEGVLEAAGATPACDRRAVGADLAGDWAAALLPAGLDPARPTAWLVEGVLFYLPREAIDRILDDVTRLSAPGSRLGFDIVNGHVLTSPWTKPWVDMQAAAGAPWIGTMDDPVADLAVRGWVAAVTQPGSPEANHGRWTLPVVPDAMTEMPHSWYVTAERGG